MSPTEFRELRKSIGLSQEALARKIGIGVRQMNIIENGDEIPARYAFALQWVVYCHRLARSSETVA